MKRQIEINKNFRKSKHSNNTNTNRHQQHQQDNMFGTFLFVDQMTQNSVLVQDLQNKYRKQIKQNNKYLLQNSNSPSTNKNKSLETSLVNTTNINIFQCLKMLRSAKKFQITSLQEKNYGIRNNNSQQKTEIQQPLNNNNNELHRMQKIKKQVLKRRKDQKQQYLRDKQKLKTILNGNINHQNNQPNSKRKSYYNNNNNMMMMRNSMSNYSNLPNFSKTNNINHLTDKQKQKQNYMDGYYTIGNLNKNKLNRQELLRQALQEAEQKQQQFIKQIQNHLKYQIKKDAQFLIPPKPKKLFLIKRRSTKQRNTLKNNRFNQSHQQLKKLNFSTEKQKELYAKFNFPSTNQQEINQNLGLTSYQSFRKLVNPKQKQLIKAIISNNYFKAEIQLSLNQQLLSTKDQKMNNLLHLCILNNNQDMFEMILKKSLKEGLNLLFQNNKFKRTPRELGNIFGLFTKKSLVYEIEQIQKKMSINLLKRLSGSIFNIAS